MRWPATVRERLYARLVPDPETGCLLWTGSCTPQGYGRIRVGDRETFVHRVAWELENGPIPDGLEIDHVKARGCRHRNCANIAHLEAVTHAENCRRGDVGKHRRRRTHCKRGHLLDEASTYTLPDGRRSCRICKLAYQRSWRQKQLEAAASP
jgi:HNH endonuclease